LQREGLARGVRSRYVPIIFFSTHFDTQHPHGPRFVSLFVSSATNKRQTFIIIQNIHHSELNKVFGTLPTELGMLTTLEFLDLEYNSLRGSLPEELCNLENLQLLILGVNDLTGPLPNCAWPKMRNARFKDNDFEGTIPTEFCDMPDLLTLIVDNNDLKGKMPACTGEQWPSLLLLALSDNYLTVRFSLIGWLLFFPTRDITYHFLVNSTPRARSRRN
jgi:hypothetical protein